MVQIRLARQRSTLAPASIAAVVLFTTTTLAQSSDDPSTPGDDPPAPTPSEDENESEDNNQPTPTPNENESEDNNQPTPTPEPSEDNEEESTTTTTTTPSAVTTTNEDGDVITEFPSLTNAPLIVTYPPAAVPPTVDAPFMHRSSAPEGTVFIVVGAILGAFGLGILLWRGIVACLLHRSVRRAAMAQHATDTKSAFPAPPAPFYKYSDHNSSLSLAAAGPGRGARRTNRGPIPSSTPSQSNLFFSPTAAGGGGGGGGAGSVNGRDSRFLPSGFYAAGNSASPGHAHSISLTNLRPESRGLSRNTMRDHTPPDSPQFTARREMSTSSLNLAAAPQGRAPSAYLEDLLDENPNAFPPSNMPTPNPQRSPGPRH